MQEDIYRVQEQSKTVFPKRINYYDIAKGIGIIMVVWVHASGPFSNYMNNFHMPFFFLISGLLYSGELDFRKYVLNKTKRLYVPFLFWNMLFNIVRSAVRGRPLKSFLRYSLSIILTLNKDGDFLGPTWFLGSLFLVAVIYKLLDLAMKKKEYRDFLFVGVSAILAFAAMHVTLKYKLSRTIICSFYYSLGVLMKKRRERIKKMDGWAVALLCLVTYVLTVNVGPSSLSKNQFASPILYFLGAIMASYAFLYACRAFDAKTKETDFLKRGLVLLGRNSMDVLIWHMLFFRIVILLQMYLNNDSITLANLLSHYPCYETANGWWLVYTIVGVFVPLAFCKLMRSGTWGKLFQKMHIV